MAHCRGAARRSRRRAADSIMAEAKSQPAWRSVTAMQADFAALILWRKATNCALQGSGQPSPAMHLQSVQATVKMANAPELSLRGGRRPTWRPEREARGSALGVQSRGGTCSPHRPPIKTHQPIASVAALIERHAGWQYLQYAFCGVKLSSLSFRGAKRRGNLAGSGPITGKPRRKRNCLPEIAPQGHFLALRAQGATSAFGLLAKTIRGRLPF